MKCLQCFYKFFEKKKKPSKILRKKGDNIVEVYFLYYLTKLHFNF